MSINPQPLVSVGVPTYNRPDALFKAIQCITKQTYKNLEIIVSDNCCFNNNNEKIIKKMMILDPRILYFKQNENIGSLLNFQFVLDRATGEYFMWFADDDLCEPEFIEELLACFYENHSLVASMSDVRVIDNNDRTIRIENLQSLYLENDWEKTRFSLFTTPPTNSYLAIYGLYKTQVLRQVGIYWIGGWKGLLIDCERCFLAKISTVGKIAAIPKTLKYYKYHDLSCSSKELTNVNKLDFLLLKVSIRIKLFKILLSSSHLSLREKFTLFWGVATSYIGVNFRYLFSNFNY